eukprot:COSAG06_NODE_44938_length_359_cov_0.592308_1_plen_46_part_01
MDLQNTATTKYGWIYIILSYHNVLTYRVHLTGAAQVAGAARPESPM